MFNASSTGMLLLPWPAATLEELAVPVGVEVGGEGAGVPVSEGGEG